jgi:hypothetical protein
MRDWHLWAAKTARVQLGVQLTHKPASTTDYSSASLRRSIAPVRVGGRSARFLKRSRPNRTFLDVDEYLALLDAAGELEAEARLQGARVFYPCLLVPKVTFSRCPYALTYAP